MILVDVVKLPVILTHALVLGIFQKYPVQLLLPVPLYELGKLPAHKAQLLARVGKLVAVEAAERGKFLVIIPAHLIYH